MQFLVKVALISQMIINSVIGQTVPRHVEDLDSRNDSQSMQGIKGIRAAIVKRSTYSWKEMGFTLCSASCLGGVQETVIACVRDSDGEVTEPDLCAKEFRPDVRIRTCNDHPCPPRWNYSDFQACTKSCGIGIKTREVTCIQEVTRGGGSAAIFPNNMCPQPPPPDRQYCNILDCPIRWHTSNWSKCSKRCGGGIKTRKVECKQVMALNHVVPRLASQCPSAKPSEQQPCGTKPCQLESDRPHIAISNTTYKQLSPNKRRVTLKIGGRAVIYAGTEVKIKCPVKKFNRTKIQWTKNYSDIVINKKYKIAKKGGALHIRDVRFSDNGKYTCIAGYSKADLYLTVKEKLGVLSNSQEIERQHFNQVPECYGNHETNEDNFTSGQSPCLQSHHGHKSLEESLAKPNRKQQNCENIANVSTTNRPTTLTRLQSNSEDPPVTPACGPAGPQYDGSGSESLPPGLRGPPDGHPLSSASTRPTPLLQQLFANLQVIIWGQKQWSRTSSQDEKNSNSNDAKGHEPEETEDWLIVPDGVLGEGGSHQSDDH